MLLSRQAILVVQDISTQDVEVPEWGGAVRVRQMTVAERKEFATKSKDTDSTAMGVWMLCMLCVDEQGKPLFEQADVDELLKRSFQAVDRVIDAVLSVNGLGDKQIEAAAKN